MYHFPCLCVKPRRCRGSGCKPRAVKPHGARDVEMPAESSEHLSTDALRAHAPLLCFPRIVESWCPVEMRIICISDVGGGPAAQAGGFAAVQIVCVHPHV